MRRHLADSSHSCLPDGQMSPNLLFWRNPGNIFFGFVLVVAIHANFHKRLKREEQQFCFLCFHYRKGDGSHQLFSSPGNQWETSWSWRTSLTPPTPLSLPETLALTTSTSTGEPDRHDRQKQHIYWTEDVCESDFMLTESHPDVGRDQSSC